MRLLSVGPVYIIVNGRDGSKTHWNLKRFYNSQNEHYITDELSSSHEVFSFLQDEIYVGFQNMSRSRMLGNDVVYT